MARSFATGGKLPVLAALLFSLMVALCDGLPVTMTLERAFPMSPDVDLSQLVACDMARHGRRLQSTTAGAVNFPVFGTYNPFIVGLYYTKVQLGNPPKDFYVQIDSGSDVLWVGCSSCSGCPSESSLKIPLKPFDPKSSSSSSRVPCSDKFCTDGMRFSEASCSVQNNLCSYLFQYADGRTTSGYYVSDTLHFDKILGGSATTNSSANIVFGCSTAVGGGLNDTDSAVDGIFGFGPQNLSVISQLASQGLTPKVFSHCLKGDDAGGGILVLGEIVEPGMVYSPLVPSQTHYNLNLESISVNGKPLNIDPSTFATSNNGGTIIDSGTTIAYLAEKAYQPFITAIDATATSNSALRVPVKDLLCYSVTSSVQNVFPQVTLNFEGNASMDLSPLSYLLKQVSSSGASIWCVGIMGIQGGLSLIGDIVLKDKIIVYDLDKQRIGWKNYDCSRSVSVSTLKSGATVTVKAGPSNEVSTALRTLPEKWTLWIVLACIICTSVLSNCKFI
ncbi:hypothetical protein SAY87_028650 [Trapa incisa]|uniref:Peptidase A1 domain-containing protein n=1 Tax=Trapa incisa TaxID=236973 RepID=A0AAN7L2I4_9MYRT|nr:hypothetical protein SAY87_028650 [Trapa incisa]